ncbi:hypothetical protein BKA62DRAFT_824248 [Auriculariales sp. MPI-PUGE-AT-0066]|nr:hypothetical protein BKA62DRAFT_824248 [Auriculariales sp. MPI-PUGE-AT-0066]
MAAIVLNDFSPAIAYTPGLSQDATIAATDGWTALFNGQSQPRNASVNGTSSHTTSLQGAVVALQFAGTAITLRGTAKGDYDVTLDGQVQKLQPSADGDLFSLDGLKFENHSVSVLARAEVVTLTGVVLPLSTTPSVNFKSSNASNWKMQGAWRTTPSVLSAQTSAKTYDSAAQGDSLSVQFQGAAVVINGLVGPDGGRFNVTVDDTLRTQLNSFSPWMVPTQLFFTTGLDPSKPHSLVISNAQQGTKLRLTSIDAASADSVDLAPPSQESPQPTAGLPQGTVIALIVGAVVAFICLLVFIFLIWRHLYWKKRRTQPSLQARDKGVSRDDFVDIMPSLPNSPAAQRQSKPRRTPAIFLPASTTSDPPSGSTSPLPTLRSSVRRKFELAIALLPTIKDGSIVSSNRSLGRRSYVRSINSLHQQYVYDARDRDDVAINTPDPDPDAGFRVSHDTDKDETDFVIDADLVFSALSKPRRAVDTDRRSSTGSVVDLGEDDARMSTEDRRRTQASFLEFMSHSSSSRGTRSARTNSMIRSISASEMTQSTTDGVSANMPYFSHINRTSVLPTSRAFDAGAPLEPAMEMLPTGTRSRPRLGIVSFQKHLDEEPLKTPTDSVPRSISPAALLAGDSPIPYRFLHNHKLRGDIAGKQKVNSITGSSFAGRPAVPSGESSRILQLQDSSESPVPSSLEVRADMDTATLELRPSSSTPLRPVESTPPPPPPSGPPPSLPHPFASAGSRSRARAGAPPVEPPVQVHVQPASPLTPLSPSATNPMRPAHVAPTKKPPSPPPWPLPTRSHKERVLRKILGDGSTVATSSRPPLPSFDRG